MRWFGNFIIVIILLSCSDVKKVKQPKVVRVEDIADTSKTVFTQYLPENWQDTSFLDGSFVKMEVVDSTVIIKWGNKDFEKILSNSIINSIIVGRLHFDWKNRDFITFSYGCGSPCWGALILPLNKNINANSFMYQYDYDQKNNLVARFDNNQEDLIVEDLISNKKQLIVSRDSTCESAFAGFCLDSVSLKNRMLYYKWSTPHFMADAKKSKEYHIRINL